tara:strand:+ start:1609 stop:3444 length:1836 start_codon:yes stop_codon:yes gene_type:complete
MSKKRAVSIKYTSREFDSIKSDLIDYIRRYYPNTYRDFNEASFGSLVIDTVAYIGDILSFYIDYQANETFVETATEYNNILRLGRQLGYKFGGAASSYGTASLYVLVPASTTGIGPDMSYVPVLKQGAEFTGTTGAAFMLNQDVHFGNPGASIRVARVDETTGNPTHYAVKTYGQVMSGELRTEFIPIGAYKKFNKITLDALDVSEVVSIVDSEGNEYFEVDYLSQNVVYRGITNRMTTTSSEGTYATGDQASEILKPVVVPRRFIKNRNVRTTEIIFGASADSEVPKDFLTEPQTSILDIHGKNYIQDTTFDPTRLIQSDKFGVAPSNTTLTVTYRINTVQNVNLRVGQLNSVGEYKMEFNDVVSLDASKVNDVVNSLEIDNEEPILGDIDIPNTDELRHRIRDTFATQNRAVTQQDYESFVYQMPPKFGSVKRCRIMRDSDSLKRNLNLYVISEDQTGILTQANSVMKNNVKTWLQKNKMINDTIDILDARVINLSIEFVAVGSLERTKFEVLSAAYERLQERFQRLPDIGEPFFVTDVYKELRNVEGILDVTDVKIIKKNGDIADRVYSDVSFNLEKMTSADGRFIEMPKNVIYEIRYPEFDIKGVIV